MELCPDTAFDGWHQCIDSSVLEEGIVWCGLQKFHRRRVDKLVIEEKAFNQNLAIQRIGTVARIDERLQERVCRLNMNASSRKGMHCSNCEEPNIVIEYLAYTNISSA
jgi:hypothetical protein